MYKVDQEQDRLQESMRDDRDMLQTEIFNVEKKLRREDAAIIIKAADLEEDLKHLERRFNAVQNKDTTFEGLCMALIEMTKIDIQLMEADEFDKNSISLIGVNEVTTTTPATTSTNNLSPSR